jgi:tRNA (guanine-N7-)-methyltransferase
MSRSMSARDQNQQHRPTSFFGRRKGPRLRPHQAELVDHLLPKLAIDATAPAPQSLAGLFAAKVVDAARLEIGFGGGEHLLGEARAHPVTGFIGCEPYLNGLAKILARLEAEPADNLRLFAGDAAELLDWLPIASLQRIDLIHPDPWPKRRHWKRRFVQRATMAAMARVLKRGGEFRFVSDIDDYAAWTLDLFQRSTDFIWIAERADDWRKPWHGFTHTRYGAKAVREGRAATYLIFRKR